MCAIFGIGFQKGHSICSNKIVREIIHKLFVESMIRGRTASGAAFCSSDEVQVVKHNLSAHEFIQLPEYKKAEATYVAMLPSTSIEKVTASKYPLVAMLGHCRLKTKGSELDNVNNHPIVRKKVVGTHNGIISNDDYLFTKFSKNFGRNGKVDSESIFALIEYFSSDAEAIAPAIQKTASLISGSYACAMTHVRYPYIVWLFRNYSPCSILHYKDVGIVIWASQEYFIKKAVKGHSFGKPEEIILEQDNGIAIDLLQNKFYKFPLDVEKEKGNTANA